jgi:hypothetical protein
MKHEGWSLKKRNSRAEGAKGSKGDKEDKGDKYSLPITNPKSKIL